VLNGDFTGAAKRLGIMSHYICDLSVFAHVMGSKTDWGAEKHHSDYESYVNQKTNNYVDEFNTYLVFDGDLTMLSAYDAALLLAHDTTFDVDGDLTCLWMDQNYDWDSLIFRNRCGESLNLSVNLIADVLHTFYREVIISEFSETSFTMILSVFVLGISVVVFILKRKTCL